MSQKPIQVMLLIAVLSAAAVAAEAGPGPGEGQQDQTAALQIPPVLASDHQALHTRLQEIRASGGEVALAADLVAERMAPHFQRENEIVMPVLGLLDALARGEAISIDRREEAIRLSDLLAVEWDQMLEEHAHIVAGLEGLRQAAEDTDRPRAVTFAEDLMAHAKTEEQVLYPTAILIGKYLRETR